MHSPTLYLDCLLLAAAIHPSGFSHSLFTIRRGAPVQVSTPLLVFLAGPYLAVTLASMVVRPGLVAFQGTTMPLLLLAAAAAPAPLAAEVVIHGLVSLCRNGRWPRGIGLDRSWSGRRTAMDHLLLGLIVLGEEFFYRVIWLDILESSWGLGFAPALAISSLAYGLNHLAFGATTVASKTAAGVFFGLLYRLGGGSIWLPFVSHELENLLLFRLTAARRVHG
jgi:membrane protease YdiL (CAAX protease family)